MGIISSCCSHDASVEAEENKSTMRKEPSPAAEADMAAEPAASREKERMLAEQKSAKETPSGSEYEITLDKTAGKKLGIDVDHKDGKTLLIECINEGLVKDWNDQAPSEKKVQIDDRITEVNGLREEVARLVEECQKDQVLKVKILRA